MIDSCWTISGLEWTYTLRWTLNNSWISSWLISLRNRLIVDAAGETVVFGSIFRSEDEDKDDDGENRFISFVLCLSPWWVIRRFLDVKRWFEWKNGAHHVTSRRSRSFSLLLLLTIGTTMSQWISQQTINAFLSNQCFVLLGYEWPLSVGQKFSLSETFGKKTALRICYRTRFMINELFNSFVRFFK